MKQAEGIQPPLYYYAAAPVTWFVSGRDKVVALRLFDVFLYLCAAVIIFFAVCDIGGTVLGGGIATLLFASANGLMDVLSYVTNGTMMLLLGAAAIWLSLRGIRDRRLTWPLTFVAAGLAITHIIVVPLAALCLLAPAVAQIRAQGRGVRRPVAKRVLVAAIPLSLWVLSNLCALPLGRAPGARRQRHRRARLGHDRQRQRVRVHGAVLPLVHHEHPGPLPPAGDQSLRLRLAPARAVRAVSR